MEDRTRKPCQVHGESFALSVTTHRKVGGSRRRPLAYENGQSLTEKLLATNLFHARNLSESGHDAVFLLEKGRAASRVY